MELKDFIGKVVISTASKRRFKIYEITTDMSTKNDSGLQTYASSNKIILCNEVTKPPLNKTTSQPKVPAIPLYILLLLVLY